MTAHPAPGDRFRAKQWGVAVLEIRAVLVHAHDDAPIPLNGYRDAWLVVATDGTTWTVHENPDPGAEPWFGTPLREREG